MERFIFVSLCLCAYSVHTYKIIPLVAEPISVQAGIEDASVFLTNLPAAINALKDIDVRNPNSSASESTKDVPNALETTTVSLNPTDVPSTDSLLYANDLKDSTLSDTATDSTSSSDGASDVSNSLTERLIETASTISTSADDSTTSLPSTTSTSLSESTSSVDLSESSTDINDGLEVTTEDLSFLSLDLLPPKTEYRKNEPDPRYDY